MSTKTCKSCARDLPLSAFHKDRQWHRSRCKQCRTAHKRATEYNLSPEAYDALLEEQGGGCGICGSDERLVVDHCHETGATRGILCSTCNRAVGMFHDNPDLLLRAVDWLTDQ